MKNDGTSVCFTDDMVRRMAKALGIEIPETPTKDTRVKIGVKELKALEKEGKIQLLGSGMAKFAHRIWELTKEGDNYFLERKEDEEV